jgi:hypothetical protein
VSGGRFVRDFRLALDRRNATGRVCRVSGCDDGLGVWGHGTRDLEDERLRANHGVHFTANERNRRRRTTGH